MSAPAPRRRSQYISWRQAAVGETLFIIPAGKTLAESMEIMGTLEAISRAELGEPGLRNDRGFASTGAFKFKEESLLRRLDHWRAIRLV